MKQLFTRVFIAALFLLLVSCASQGGRLVTASDGIKIFDDMAVDSSLDWARMKYPRAQLWTIDGSPLNQFIFISKVKPNEHVFLSGRERKRRPDGPWFKPGMRPDEVQNIMLDGWREGGFAQVAGSNLRPAKFGNIDGLRFNVTMTNQNGLIYKGTAGAVERNGRLNVMYWIAPQEHYYGRDISAINKMFDSFRFTK